jgi:hypothetical protein
MHKRKRRVQIALERVVVLFVTCRVVSFARNATHARTTGPLSAAFIHCARCSVRILSRDRMGLCGGGTPEDREAKRRNREINKQLKSDREQAAREVKLLLLGAPFALDVHDGIHSPCVHA